MINRIKSRLAFFPKKAIVTAIVGDTSIVVAVVSLFTGAITVTIVSGCIVVVAFITMLAWRSRGWK